MIYDGRCLANKSGAKPRRADGLRVCVDCDLAKPVDEYTRIRACVAGWYGRCRACRARRAWERSHPGQRYEERLERKATTAVTRVCSDCGLEKPITEYTPIKSCVAGWYGRCKICRNRRARERYHSSAEIQAAEFARSARNEKQRRLSSAAPRGFIVGLRAARGAGGLTQIALTERAGLAPETIGQLERGEHSARSRTINALASALGVPANVLRVSASWPAD